MGTAYFLFSVALGLCLSLFIKFYNERNPGSEAFLARTTLVTASVPVRMAQAVGYQLLGRTPVCDFLDNDLEGQLIVLTGGTSGIGFETVMGLLRRGADVIVIGRNGTSLQQAADRIKKEFTFKDSQLRHIEGDMSDLHAVSNIVRAFQHHLNSRQIDQLILNAAVWPQAHSVSPQGYEIAFATNVAGPHLLLRALIASRILKEDARVISLTGDIYITLAGTANEGCSENFTYSSPAGQAGQDAYSRSKLGAMWLFYKMHAHFPTLQMNLVHPGVMDNALAGHNPLPKALLLSNNQGAQTTLICATAPRAQLESGAYYHNTLGKVVLPSSDPARNSEKAEAFVALVEGIIAPYLRALIPEQSASSSN